MGKVYTVAEVSKHNNAKDVWLIIAGKVYDMTNYLDDHPGGDQVLINVAGKDATYEFEDINHSESARAHMEDFYIGEIETSNTAAKLNDHKPSKQSQYNNGKSTESIIKLLQFLLPLFILSVAVGVRFYTKSSA